MPFWLSLKNDWNTRVLEHYEA